MKSGNLFEYIVVGSGAGGGTLAARLAEAGGRYCC
jgi:choline dehydrogenase-like flavoprotein